MQKRLEEIEKEFAGGMLTPLDMKRRSSELIQMIRREIGTQEPRERWNGQERRGDPAPAVELEALRGGDTVLAYLVGGDMHAIRAAVEHMHRHLLRVDNCLEDLNSAAQRTDRLVRKIYEEVRTRPAYRLDIIPGKITEQE